MGHHHHQKDCSHHHSSGGHGHHHHGPANYNKAFAIAVGANLIFTLGEAVFALAANSMSLLADAGHNLGDVLGLLFAWLASWLLTLKPAGRFSYGFKRSTILASLANAMLLVFASALIVSESIDKFFNPQPISELTVMIVAGIGILINGGTALLFMRGQHEDLNIRGAFLHLAYDALISLGVVITAGLIFFTGWVWLDPVIGLGIVVMILLGSWGLLKESVQLILDAVPSRVDQNKVSHYLESLPGVTAVHDLHIWGLSTSGIALTAHLVMPNTRLTDEEYQHINTHLKQTFGISHATIQVEQGHESHPCQHTETC